MQRLSRALVLLIVATAPVSAFQIEVAQESAPGANDFDGNLLGVIETVDSPLNAVEYYSYNSPIGASYNGEAPQATNELSFVFILNTTTTDSRSLIVVHDGINDNNGGGAAMRTVVSNDPNGAQYLVLDDSEYNGDGYTGNAGDEIFTSYHGWAPCCTDGFALGTLEGEWDVYLEFTAPTSGLQWWRVYSGSGETISLNMTPGRRVRLRYGDFPSAPELIYPSGTGFESDGIDPDSGNESVPIEYRVIYRSEDGIPPAGGMPRVVIEADGDTATELLGEGSFAMSPLDAGESYEDGRAYRFVTNLPFLPGYAYEYRFEAIDSLGAEATGEPTAWQDGPASNATDIAIYADGISFQPAAVDTGEIFVIEARVYNHSLETVSDVKVRFYDETSGQVIEEVVVGSIPSGSWIPAFSTYAFSDPGFYPIRVVVDVCCPEHEEWNELNNNAVRGILVGDYDLPAWIEIDGGFSDPVCYRDGAWAAGTATYEGLPIDGMPVRGAQVTVSLLATGQQFAGVTNDNGEYEVEVDVDALSVGGPYEVEVEITDFTVSGESDHDFTIVNCPALADLALTLDFNGNCFVGGEIRPVGGRIWNHGVIPAENFLVRLYVDGDLHYERLIPFLDVDGVVELTDIGNVSFSVGDAAVWHSIYGIVDPENAVDEYRSDNNIVNRSFRVWPTCPDAVAGGVYLSDNSPATNQLIGITGRVINMGGEALTGPLSVALYERLGGDFDEIWSSDIAAPEPCGGIAYVQANHRFDEPGTHTVRLHADPDGIYAGEECTTANNILDRAVAVHDPIPDFLVRYEELVVDDPQASPGDSVHFIATVRNLGESDYGGAVPVRFRLDGSTHGPIGQIPDGIPLGAARPCTSSVFWTGEWAADPDSHMVDVKADPEDAIPEVYEFNNQTDCRLPVDFLFLGISDCAMFQDTQDPRCDEVLVDDEVQIHARIANYGCFSATDPIEVRFYDDFLDNSELIGTAWIEQLGDHHDEQGVSITHTFTLEDVGLHTIRVEIDEDQEWDGTTRWAEYTRTNNVLSRQLRVVSAYPDITLSSQHINPSLLTPCEGDSVSVTVTVWNEGLLDAETFQVRTKVDSTDFGSLYEVPWLGYEEPNYVSFETDSVWVVTAEDRGPHAFWIISDCLDEIVEMDEENNEATRVILVCEDVPDLYVLDQELAVAPLPESNSEESAVGRRYLLSSKIRNSGGVPGQGMVRFYYQTSPGDSVFIGSDDIYVSPADSTLAEVTWVAEVDSCVIKVVISGEEEEVNYTNNTAASVFDDGDMVTAAEEITAAVPRMAVLHPNAPNPFNPSTTIRFELPGVRKVRMQVYSVDGRLVRTLLEEVLPAGRYALRWDGRDDDRRPVAGGVYFCRMRAGRFQETLKLVLLK